MLHMKVMFTSVTLTVTTYVQEVILSEIQHYTSNQLACKINVAMANWEQRSRVWTPVPTDSLHLGVRLHQNKKYAIQVSELTKLKQTIIPCMLLSSITAVINRGSMEGFQGVCELRWEKNYNFICTKLYLKFSFFIQ